MGSRSAALAALFVAVLAVTGSGCGGGSERYAPVSGTVLLNDKPLVDAKLIFEPVGDKNGVAPGKPSYGKTDPSGRYTLRSPIAERDGAAVGDHRVRIVTMKAPDPPPEKMEAARKKLQRDEKAGGGDPNSVTDARVREYLSDVTPTTHREGLPARYNTETELTFKVEPAGTDKADFSLQSP